MSVNSGEITLQLSHPLTEEQWDTITDADLEHTNSIWFHTKHGKDVEFVKVVRCKDCKRNADNGGLYPNGRTQCPIQEHYALLQDGYCHLGECKEVQHNFNASNTLDALETEVTE